MKSQGSFLVNCFVFSENRRQRPQSRNQVIFIMKKDPIKVTVGYIYNKKDPIKVTIFICNEI